MALAPTVLTPPPRRQKIDGAKVPSLGVVAPAVEDVERVGGSGQPLEHLENGRQELEPQVAVHST